MTDRPTAPGSSTASPTTTTAPSRSHVFFAAAWVGILAGLMEGAVIKVGSALLHLPTGGLAPLELFWMAPLAATGSLLLVGLLLVAVGTPLARVTRRPLASVAFAVFVALAIYSFVRSMRLGVAWYAALVLAIGIAVVTARLVEKRPAFLARRVPRMALWMAGVLVLYAAAIPIWRRTSESRAMAALPPAAAPSPNVLVIVWDAVRHFDLSLYGYDRATTPELAAFAQRGAVFERAFTTAPWSLPSHASMLTGRNPQEMTTGHRQPLDESQVLISEALDKRGYATGGFVGNPYWLQPDFGVARGFTTWDALPAMSLGTIISTWWLAKSTWTEIALARGDHRELVRRRASDVNNALISWLGRRGDRPFFAFLNYFDAHEPYLPPAPFDTLFAAHGARYWHDELPRPYSPTELKETRDVYDEGIRYLDTQLKDLLDRLQAMHLLDSTVVIVTADHGEEFGEHDPSLVAHSLTLHTTSTLVPMVVVYPKRIPAGVRVWEPVSIRDIPATVMDLTGAAEQPFPSVSMARYVGDSASRAPAHPVVMTVEKKKTGNLPPWSANDGHMYGVVDGSLHYILDAQQKDQLFDLSTDLWEKENLAPRPERQADLQRLKVLLDSLVKGPDGKLRPRAPAKGRDFGGGKFIRRR
ncbi:MAG: sulfatase-like hydrolase/transferase [Gemmatimonadaceae bacterium]